MAGRSFRRLEQSIGRRYLKRASIRVPLRAVLWLAVLASLFSSQASALLAAPTSAFDPRFGAVEAFRFSKRADEIGVRWTRIAFWWSGLQPDGPGGWNQFYFPDEYLQDELNSGRQVVGLLINTPRWAGDGGPNSPPHGLHLSLDHPDNHWARFARSMAERYRGRIDHWVVWNEPDIWAVESPTYTWTGSVEDFYRLQKTGYLAIKQGNKNAQVGLAGMTYWWDYFYNRQQYFERFLEVAERDPEAPANNWFFDAAVLHLYNEPEGLYRAPALFRQYMGARGFNKPIWINETNVAPWDDPANPMPRSDFRATLDEQGSFIVQAFAWGLAAGAERISVYPFSDGSTPLEQMGLVRSDGSTRPAYQALRTVTQYMNNVRDAWVEREGDAVKVVLKKDHGRVTVAWSMAPRPASVSIEADTDSALLVDKYGGRQRIEAENGVYHLALQPATTNTANGDPSIYLIGGNPLLIVEGD
jgi:hypothetical protein